MTRTPVRLVASHALAATAMAMPWPALLAAVWAAHHSGFWLAVTGVARLAPYVLLSMLAGALADRVARLRLLRWSSYVRSALLGGCALAFATDRLEVAVVLATAAVAVGTPAYPALVAAMPDLGGARTARLTDAVVTVEVSAFVVGPAVGGLLWGIGGGTYAVVLAAVLALGAGPLLAGFTSTPPAAVLQRPRLRMHHMVQHRSVRVALLVVATVNAVDAGAALGLVSLSDQSWSGGGFGFATAALGFGALGAPLVRLRGLGWVAAGLAVCLVVVAISSTYAWALVPLALAGAATTKAECVATALLQRNVPDDVRAFALGLADTTMVLAGLVGAASAPAVAGLVGPRATFGVLAGVVGVVAVGLGAFARHCAALNGVALTGAAATRAARDRRSADLPLARR